MYASKTHPEFDHAPLAKLDYGFSWPLATGETIVSSVWTATTGITLTNQAVTVAVTAVFASGGEVGKIYLLTNAIETSLGKKDSRTISLSCKWR